MSSKVSPTKDPKKGVMPDLESASNVSIISTVPSDAPVYKVYKERWLVLITMVTLITTNIMQWSSYSALIKQTDIFHCGPQKDTCKASFIANQTFQAMAVVLSVIGMYLATKFGILPTLRSCAFANLMGAILRLIASNPHIESFTVRKNLMFTGAIVTSIAQMYFVITTKMAESWFPPSNRASANVACGNSLALGVVFGTLLPSLFLDTNNTDPNIWGFFILNCIITTLCLIPMGLSIILKNSLPPTPPSVSFHEASDVSVTKSICQCLRNIQFVIQNVIGMITFSSVIVVVFLNDSIGEKGYKLMGYPITIATACSIFAAYFAGKVADKTKKFKEIVLTCLVLLACTSILVKLHLQKTRSGWYDDVIVIILFACTMSCTSAQLPIGQEIAVETTFPVHEAISCAILNFFGQLWMLFIYFLLDFLKSVNLFYPKTTYGNWQLSLDLWVFFSCANAIFAVLCLKPQYNRLKVENESSNMIISDK